MRAAVVAALRLLIVALACLPLLKPFVRDTGADEKPRTVTLLLSAADVASGAGVEAAARAYVRDRYGGGVGALRLETRTWGREDSHPAEDLEELGLLLDGLEGPLLLLPRSTYWGPAASRFQERMRATPAFREKRLALLPRTAVLGEADPARPPARYLAVSEVFLPKASFLGEESVASVEILGRLPAGENAEVEVLLRSGASLLSARTETVSAGEDGVVRRALQVPVNFVRAGAQTLTASISTPLASEPLSSATTVVTVHHAKTTLLHIGVGPDWSLRSFRQKLKFWPNLDLLSYYILREASDDMSVPSNQLSLIEFPAEKLFGSELPNFHGVVAQNFLFENYLNPQDVSNLVDYVQAGGRMLFQAGPLSFASREPRLQALFPCESPPRFDSEKEYAWKEGNARVSADVDLIASIRALSSRFTGLGCVPKKEALVLARTAEGDHPVVLAMPMGKGLVLTILAGDWHTAPLASEAEGAFDRARKLARTQAVDAFFQWVVEFLQRRQDGGLRAPDVQSPRLYEDDLFVLLKSRGPLRLDESFALQVGGKTLGEASPVPLPWLGLHGLRLPGGARTRAGAAAAASGIEDPGAAGVVVAASETRFVPVTLRIASREDPVVRTLDWPLHAGTTRTRERLANPVLFEGVDSVGAPSKEGTSDAVAGAAALATASVRPVPLLSAYPWLLAALLALLCLERLLVHVFAWGRREPVAG